MQRVILHSDMNNFYASVECLYRPELMTWGLPQYKGSGVIINARSETAAEKPTFRQALQSRRCVVISMGFYEWDKKGKEKTKYLFTFTDEPVLYMAGLYNPADPLGCFVILTTAANESMADIHDRMPVLLSADERERWLTDRRFAEACLKRVPANLQRRLGSKIEQ